MKAFGFNQSLSKFSQKTDIRIELQPFADKEKSELELLVRYMYYRSSESRLSVDPELAIGQDYLEWYFDQTNDSFSFVVCDGVGQSFLGYIAAEFLGRHLIDWLKNSGHKLINMTKKGQQSGLGEIIKKEINAWQKDANQKVKNWQLPLSLPAMVRTALEESRDINGSETVFVCGHIGLVDKLPYLILFWMGDVRFRLFDASGKELDTSARWVNAERWSTKHGSKGRSMPNFVAVDLHQFNVSRIMAYSDGLSTIENRLPQLSSKDLHWEANKLLVSPSSDDISFIDILLPQTEKDVINKFKELPAIPTKNDNLRIFPREISPSEFELTWRKVENANQYIIIENSPDYVLTLETAGQDIFEKPSSHHWREVYRSTEPSIWLVKGKMPGLYRYKLIVIYNDANEEESSEEIALEFKAAQTTQNSVLTEPAKNKTPLLNSRIQTSNSSVLEAMKQPKHEQVELAAPKVKVTTDPDKQKVFIGWEKVENANSYSVSIIEKVHVKQVFYQDNIIKTDLPWIPEKWIGEYDVYVRAYNGQIPVPSLPYSIILGYPKPPTPIIKIPQKITIGKVFQLSCELPGKIYSKLLNFEWRYSRFQDMKLAEPFLSSTNSHIEHKHDKQGLYYYQVRVQHDGTWSDWSISEPILVGLKLDDPIIIAPGDSSKIEGDFILKWSDVAGAEKYVVQYKSVLTAWKWVEYTKSDLQKKGQIWECAIVENEKGKWTIRILASDRMKNFSVSQEVNIEIVRKAKLLPVNKPLRIVEIRDIKWHSSGRCEVYWNESRTRYVVLQFRSNDLTSYVAHKIVSHDSRTSFDITTPGKYYFCVLEDFRKDGGYDLPESTQRFFEFIVPLRRPIWIPNTIFQIGSALDKRILKVEWQLVAYADEYRFDVNGVTRIIPSSSSNLISAEVEIAKEGLYKVEIQAFSRKYGSESDIKKLRFNVEKRNQQFEIIEHQEN